MELGTGGMKHGLIGQVPMILVSRQPLIVLSIVNIFMRRKNNEQHEQERVDLFTEHGYQTLVIGNEN